MTSLVPDEEEKQSSENDGRTDTHDRDPWGDDDYLPTDGYTNEQDQYYYGDIDNDPIDGDI